MQSKQFFYGKSFKRFNWIWDSEINIVLWHFIVWESPIKTRNKTRHIKWVDTPYILIFYSHCNSRKNAVYIDWWLSFKKELLPSSFKEQVEWLYSRQTWLLQFADLKVSGSSSNNHIIYFWTVYVPLLLYDMCVCVPISTRKSLYNVQSTRNNNVHVTKDVLI